jgi:hypothetical protein
MRLSRPIGLAVLAAALAVPAPSHAAPRAGAWIYINPAVRRAAVDFTSWARATGSPLGGYAAHWTVDGVIEGSGYVTAVADSWSLLMTSPGGSTPEHHVYPVASASNVALVYTGWVVAPGSGVPTVYCQSVLTRVHGGTPSIDGTC